jgi:hypothetical protein
MSISILTISILTLIAVSAGLLVLKPTYFFDEMGEPRPFGSCKLAGQILLPYYSVGLISGIAAYILLTLSARTRRA